MKRPEHIEAAERIGEDSWALLNFESLSKYASAPRQIAALDADRAWQRLKHEETRRAIDKLINDIVSTSNESITGGR